MYLGWIQKYPRHDHEKISIFIHLAFTVNHLSVVPMKTFHHWLTPKGTGGGGGAPNCCQRHCSFIVMSAQCRFYFEGSRTVCYAPHRPHDPHIEGLSQYTVYPRSSDPFHVVTYYITWVTTSMTYSIWTL